MSNRFFATSRLLNFNPYLIAVAYKWFAVLTVIILMIAGIKKAPYLLVILTVVYNALFSFLVLRFQLNPGHRLLLIAVDFIMCISLIFFSGGWMSPYFQYGLSFMILSALSFGFKGAGLSIVLYGAFFYLALYANGFTFDRIIEKGYLEPFITDYIIFIAIGFSFAFISKLINDRSLSVLNLDNQGQQENQFEEISAAEQSEDTFSLTARELKIASLLLNGLNNKKIASNLNISINTVKFHIGNIYRKLGVKNRKF